MRAIQTGRPLPDWMAIDEAARVSQPVRASEQKMEARDASIQSWFPRGAASSASSACRRTLFSAPTRAALGLRTPPISAGSRSCFRCFGNAGSRSCAPCPMANSRCCNRSGDDVCAEHSDAGRAFARLFALSLQGAFLESGDGEPARNTRSAGGAECHAKFGDRLQRRPAGKHAHHP